MPQNYVPLTSYGIALKVRCLEWSCVIHHRPERCSKSEAHIELYISNVTIRDLYMYNLLLVVVQLRAHMVVVQRHSAANILAHTSY
jgi:hypothetical protein